MEILIIILSVTILILLLALQCYRRQVKTICRQLAFLKEHESNMLVTSDTDGGGLGELKEGINDILKRGRAGQRSYAAKEKSIAETYTCLSHDIRTPLTSLYGYFELLSECEAEEDKQRYISIIRERINSLNDMLDELFTFTKLKNDSYQLELSRINLSKLLKEIILSYYEDWIAEGIEPVLNITETPVYIEANAQALHRVIQNIVKNVLEHGENQIQISLQQAENNIPKNAVPNKNDKTDKTFALIISNQVRNTTGIDTVRVFEQFYKADSARSRSSTGLGLSIAQGLVKEMNGAIRAELSGNIFSITIEFTACK